MSVTEPPPEMEVEVRSIWWVAVAVCLVSVFFFLGGEKMNMMLFMWKKSDKTKLR